MSSIHGFRGMPVEVSPIQIRSTKSSSITDVAQAAIGSEAQRPNETRGLEDGNYQIMTYDNICNTVISVLIFLGVSALGAVMALLTFGIIDPGE